jgi:hypothetical protein
MPNLNEGLCKDHRMPAREDDNAQHTMRLRNPFTRSRCASATLGQPVIWILANSAVWYRLDALIPSARLDLV